MSCFNCATTEDVHSCSFDMDLPKITACPTCVFALGQDDQDLLKAMRPRKKRKAKA